MRRPSVAFAFVTAFALLGAACGSSSKPATSSNTPTTQKFEKTIVLMTHDSFAVSKPVLAAFEQQTGYDVKVLKSGDAGEAVQQGDPRAGPPGRRRVLRRRQHVPHQCARRQPVRAVHREGTRRRPHRPAGSTRSTGSRRSTTATCASTTTWRGSGTTVTRLRPRRWPISRSRSTEISWSSRTPCRRRPGSRSCSRRSRPTATTGGRSTGSNCATTAFVSSTAGSRPTTPTSPQAGASGDRPLVVSYATDPAADVVFSDGKKTTPTVGVVPGTCFAQVEFAGVLDEREATRPARAR